MTDKLQNLKMFTGSEQFIRTHRNVVCTEGVMYVAENANAYWLIDIIASYQTLSSIRKENFQVYNLKVDLEKNKGVVECTDGNGNKLYEQKIKYTDFPISEITIWYVDGIALLPSEY